MSCSRPLSPAGWSFHPMINMLRVRAMVGLFMAALLGCASDQASKRFAGDAPAAEQSAVAGESPAMAMAAPAPARAVSYAQAQPVDSADVVRWSAQGLREDIIIDRIERSPTVF